MKEKKMNYVILPTKEGKRNYMIHFFLFNHSVTILFYATTFIKVSQSILLSCLHFLSTVFTFIKYTVDSIVIFLSMHLDKWPPMAKAAMTQTWIW